MKEKKKKMPHPMNKKTAKLIRYSVIIIALFVFGYSTFQLVDTYLGYKEGTDAYEDIQNEFFGNLVVVDDDNSNASDDSAEDETDEAETDSVSGSIDITNDTSGDTLSALDFAGLVASNSDSVGWIKQVNNSYINYPIVQTTNNDYYVHRLFDLTYNLSGSIFVDCRCSEALESKNVLIYGHNMYNKSMFGTLKYYYEKDGWYDDHKYFDIWSGYTHYRYEVFCLIETNVNSTDFYDKITFSTDEDFMEWITKRREEATFDTDVEVTEDDYVVSLSTCLGNGRDGRRFIVMLVRTATINDEDNSVTQTW